MSWQNITHYYPNAMLIFVSSYQKDSNNLSSVVFSNLGDVKEIQSIRVSLTVKSSPGTLSATIVNTGKKFFREDDPEKEIPILYNYSNKKKKINVYANISSNSQLMDSFRTVSEEEHSNFYEFSSYDEWEKYEYIILEDKETQLRYPLFNTRNSLGKVQEYWTYDIDGNIIVIKDINQIKQKVSGEEILINVNNSTRVFIIYKYNNQAFTTTYKDIDVQGKGKKYERGRCRIEPMDRVICYMSKRFDNRKVSDMIRVFTGVVDSVEDSYSGDQELLNIQCTDVTKYMKLSYINVNPALLLDKATDINQTPDQKLTIWTSILKGLRAPDIIRLVTLGHKHLSKKTSQTQSIDGIGYYDASNVPKIGTRIRFSPEDNSFIEVTQDGNRKKISFKEALGALFTTSTVHIVDPFNKNTHLKGFRPYEISLSLSWSYYQGEWKTRREIAERVAEDSHFNFYADRNGEIWFHPLRFDNSWIFACEDPRIYIIDTDSIISYGFVESDQNIYSTVYASTEPDFAYESLQSLGWYARTVRDDGVTMKYGQRFFTVHNPIINTKDKTDKAIIAFAKSVLQRLLAGRYQGQVTIVGRPEIDPGRPVYIPLVNRVYYVETVEHSFSFGSQFTTTLSLSYGRKPWEYLPEIISFSESDEIYLVDAHVYQYVETLTNEAKKNVKNPK